MHINSINGGSTMIINTYTVKAIASLAPDANFRTGNGKVIWDSPDIAQPSEADIITKASELEAEYDTLQYQRDREPDYPNLAEQFDLLWHAIDSDTLDKTSDFYTTLKAVKDAHPKG